MRYLLPLFECEIETMMLKTKYYRKMPGLLYDYAEASLQCNSKR